MRGGACESAWAPMSQTQHAHSRGPEMRCQGGTVTRKQRGAAHRGVRGGAGDAGRLGALGLKGSALRLERGQLQATRSDRCVTGLAERARRGPPAHAQATQYPRALCLLCTSSLNMQCVLIVRAVGQIVSISGLHPPKERLPSPPRHARSAWQKLRTD